MQDNEEATRRKEQDGGRETKAIQLKFLEPESRTLDLIAILQGHETGF
jgi:hypothetical protein